MKNDLPEPAKMYFIPASHDRLLLVIIDPDGNTRLQMTDSKEQPVDLDSAHTQFLAHVLNKAIEKARD